MGFALAIVVFAFAVVVIWLVLGWSKKSSSEQRRRQGGSVGGDDELYGRFRRSTSLLGEWFLIPWLISQCRRRNPLLTASQEIHLEQMFKSVLEAWKNGQAAIPLLRATVALAVPEAHLAITLVEAFVQRYWPNKSISSPLEANTPDGSEGGMIPSGGEKHVVQELHIVQELTERLGCDVSRVKAIQDGGVQRAILQALKNGQDLTCPITLEPILNAQTGKILPDTAALVQQQQQPDQPRHVFLYKKAALEQWFASAPAGATNPLNRQHIDRAREFFILS